MQMAFEVNLVMVGRKQVGIEGFGLNLRKRFV
jgi:hypothetical protein